MPPVRRSERIRLRTLNNINTTNNGTPRVAPVVGPHPSRGGRNRRGPRTPQAVRPDGTGARRSNAIRQFENVFVVVERMIRVNNMIGERLPNAPPATPESQNTAAAQRALNNLSEDMAFVNVTLNEAISIGLDLQQLDLIRARTVRFLVDEFIHRQQGNLSSQRSFRDVAFPLIYPAILRNVPPILQRAQDMRIRLMNALDPNSQLRSSLDAIVASIETAAEVIPLSHQSHQVAFTRLRRELCQFMREPPENCSVDVDENNLFHWIATITGPAETPYADGVFLLSMLFPADYPFNPPRVQFITRVYHCNVDEAGHICMDILANNWSPALTVSKILLSISSLLSDPNPLDPLRGTIGTLFQRDRARYDYNAREWTKLFAAPIPGIGNADKAAALPQQ